MMFQHVIVKCLGDEVALASITIFSTFLPERSSSSCSGLCMQMD